MGEVHLSVDEVDCGEVDGEGSDERVVATLMVEGGGVVLS